VITLITHNHHQKYGTLSICERSREKKLNINETKTLILWLFCQHPALIVQSGLLLSVSLQKSSTSFDFYRHIVAEQIQNW